MKYFRYELGFISHRTFLLKRLTLTDGIWIIMTNSNKMNGILKISIPPYNRAILVAKNLVVWAWVAQLMIPQFQKSLFFQFLRSGINQKLLMKTDYHYLVTELPTNTVLKHHTVKRYNATTPWLFQKMMLHDNNMTHLNTMYRRKQQNGKVVIVDYDDTIIPSTFVDRWKIESFQELPQHVSRNRLSCFILYYYYFGFIGDCTRHSLAHRYFLLFSTILFDD